MDTNKNGDPVAAVYERQKSEDQRSQSAATTNSSLPNSKKIYVAGKLHPAIGVPFREISLAPTKSMNGEIEVNEPVRVYDTSGQWGDPDFDGDVAQGLPPLRAKWIRDRGDVEEYEGRKVQPIDDGWLSEAHAEHAAKRNGSEKDELKSKRLSTNASPARTNPQPAI
jgi:phosphomethylpyrimidine synthase